LISLTSYGLETGTKSLLDLLAHLDDEIRIFRRNLKHERLATLSLYNYLCPFKDLVDTSDERRPLNDVYVIRNFRIEPKDYEEIFDLPYDEEKTKTELDFMFLNVPSIFGNKSIGRINYYVEVELKGELFQAINRLKNVRKYFRERGLNLYPLLVYEKQRKYDVEDDIPSVAFDDLAKVILTMSIRSIRDIPGLAYDDSAVAIYLLEEISKDGIVRRPSFIKDLWSHENLRRYENIFRSYIMKRDWKGDRPDYENKSLQFDPRMQEIFEKLHKNGYIERIREEEDYCLTLEGAQLLVKYREARKVE